MLTGIWIELLGVKPVGIDDNFFDLGGHSLLIIRLINDVRKSWGLRLGLASVLQNPRSTLLARLISENRVIRADLRVVPLQEGNQETPPLYFIGAGTDESGLQS